MQRNFRLLTSVGSVVLAFGVSSCGVNERVHNMGPDVTADLIVYFKTDVTQPQIDDFWNNVLSYPDPNGRGQFLRPGVGRLSRITAVEGHEGIAVVFQWPATPSDRAELRRLIDASPVVYAVRENVAPINVKTLKG